MRRALGVVVVMGLIGLWNAFGAWSLRSGAGNDETQVTDRLPGADALPAPPAARPATPTTSRFPDGTSFRVDPLRFLSTAPADSLDLVPGVGPVLAARIIDARRARGFTSWNDVLAIRGIGPATVARWRALAGQ
jgi:predicted flap endonuclease-1-like 5' DNA nuclease